MISHIHIDPIHGKIELPPFIQMIINTEEFQRLRNLRQLGLSHWKFPGCCHTRYEHCIGVFHLTRVLLDHIKSNSNAEMNEFFVNCVKAAGLLHDVGHGPFSHLWDRIDEKLGENQWSHEKMSCKITESIFQKYNIEIPGSGSAENINAAELISAFIVGDTHKLVEILGPNQMFLSEIVNNKFCAIDVDKWDYILRDTYYLNNAIVLPMEFTKCFEGASIKYDIENVSHISYHEKDRRLVHQLFMNRKLLHVDCYQHPEVAVVEQMVLDALTMAEKGGFRFNGLRLTEVHTNLDVFKHFDDSILNVIEITTDKELTKAKNIIRRIKMGAWYKYIIYLNGNIPEQDSGFANGSCNREQRILAARTTMPDTIQFHGDPDDRQLIINYDYDDEDVYRTIVYTPE